MESLAPLLSGIKDIAVLVPVLGCVGLGWLHVVWRREEREDRKALLEVISRNTEALNGVRVAIAAQTGKAL